MDVRAILPLLATALACASAPPGEMPYCLSPDLRAETSIDCRVAPEFSFYQGDLVDAIDRELRSEHFGSLSVSVEFDPIESLPSVCISRNPESVPWVVRQELARCNAALRRLRPGPACVAGTRLDLTDALAAASETSGLRRRPDTGVTPGFSIRGAR